MSGLSGGRGSALRCAPSDPTAVDLGTECGDEGVRRPFVGANVEVLDLLADDPGGHRVDVEAFDVAANAVCLDQWRATTDERVDDPQAGKVIRLKKGLFQRFDVSLIAQMALREKQIQQNYRPIIGVHKWFARRPGT